MPTLADIRDTSSVEDDSDIVIFGHREYKNKPDLGDEWKYYGELAIAKQRDGELCRIPMMYVGENTRWLNWPADQEKPSNKVRGAGSAKGPL
jgi:replicative DNA helicase